jgi:hypothetical protein
MTELQNRRVQQMMEVQSKGLELFKNKNRDYGDAFSSHGVIGVLMRIGDKIQRSMSITKSGINLVEDERLEDTLLDLHNYAAMALMLLNEAPIDKKIDIGDLNKGQFNAGL